MVVGMKMAAVASNDDDDADKDNSDKDNGNKTQMTINLCVGDEQPWAWQRRLWRRIRRRWCHCAIVIVLVAVETMMIT